MIAYHLIWTMYGWWLPNDPRGSMSDHIESALISELGDIHYGRKRIQPCSRDVRELYDDAKSKLQHELLNLKPSQFHLAAKSFGEVIRREGYTCYAWAVMPDHIHALIRKHRDHAEVMIEKFQDASRGYFRGIGLRPDDHPVWGGPGWKVFLDTPDDIHRVIKYINDNPKKMRLKDQHWDFVTPYDNWPLHRKPLK